MFFIGILLPYDNERLLASGSKTAQSPLTISLEEAGILPAAHLINALIVISVISAGNSSLYVASRTMLYMGRTGKAPKFLGRTNRAGVPWVGLIFSNLFACISFLSLSSNAGKLYSALITLSGGKFKPRPNKSSPILLPVSFFALFTIDHTYYIPVCTFLVWAVIGITHIRFRQALTVQGEDPSTLPFQALFYPYGTYAALAANVFLIFFQGYPAFLNPFSAEDFVINYILLPVFVGFVLFWKLYKRTKIVKLAEMDIWTGRREYDDISSVVKNKTFWRRVKDVVVG